MIALQNSLWMPISADEISPVFEQYGVNKSTAAVFVNTTAHTNQIYKVESAGCPTIVIRAVNPETYGVVRSKPAHLQFEIEILDHLAARSFALTPKVLKNRQNEAITHYNQRAHVAFNLMPGSPIGNFNDLCALSEDRRQSLFFGLGQMSCALSQFEVPLAHEKTLSDLCLEAGHACQRLFAKIDRAGLEVIEPHKAAIDAFVETANSGLTETQYDKLPRQPVHFDLHAGNILFEGATLSAVLDWDWSRLDCRISDLASCLAMCCYVYGGSDDGLYLPEQIKAGVQAFRAGFGKSEFKRQQENELLKTAFKGYVLMQFVFTLQLYVDAPSPENLVDLQHFLRLIVRNDFDALIQLED